LGGDSLAQTRAYRLIANRCKNHYTKNSKTAILNA